MNASIQDPAFKTGFMSALAGDFRAAPAMFGFTVEEKNRFYKGWDAGTDLNTDEHVAAAKKYFRYGVI